MKLALVLLAISVSALAQTVVRVDPLPASTIASNVRPGGKPPILALPNTSIAVCGYPANANPCTNFAQTYTDSSAGTACPLAEPVVLAGTSTCQSTTDAQGNFGFWMVAGLYSYTETLPNGTVFGPFPLSVPGLTGPSGPAGPTIYKSVKDYGAIGNDATDDTAAFQAGMAAVTASGGVLFVPCGTYLTTGTITMSRPTVSLLGETMACSRIHYTGSGSAILWQMNPFTTTLAGVISNLTIIGTNSGLNGILGGSAAGATYQNVSVSGFNGAGAAGIHLHNIGHIQTWTEENYFINVTVGGDPTTPHNTNGVLLTSDAFDDSFGHNHFLGLHVNASTGQVGFNLQSGFFDISQLYMDCNADNNLAGSPAALCFRSNSNWDNNTVQIVGEFIGGGPGTGTQYSGQVESGGRFANLKGSNVLVLGGAGARLPLNNLRGATAAQDVTLVEASEVTSWDTGTFSVSGTNATPEPIARGSFGSVGMLIGNNVESPYVSMFNFTGNKFIIGALGSGSIGTMVEKASFDTAGDMFAGKIWLGGITGSTTDAAYNFDTAGRAFVRGDVPPSAGFPKLPLTVGYRTSGSLWSGGAALHLGATTGINELISLGENNQAAGIGSVIGVNIAHPIAWCYNIDPNCFEWYGKPFQTGLLPGHRVAELTNVGVLSIAGSQINMNSAGASIQFGSSGPSGACVNGSLATNSTGGAGDSLFICFGGSWNAVTIP